MAKSSGIIVPKLYKGNIHVPCTRPAHCGSLLALGLTPSASTPWKSDVHVKSLMPVSMRLPLTKFKHKKTYREKQCKTALISQLTAADSLSAMQNGQCAAETFTTGGFEPTPAVYLLTVSLPNHQAMSLN